MANYDDSETGGYSYAEKLAMVAKGLMDPKDIGMTNADDAIYEITGLKKPDPQAFLSDFLTLEMSVVPLPVQAKWARQELTIIPTNPKAWETDWVEQHKNEFRVQAVLHSGSLQARLDQTFTDPIYGFVELIRQAGELLKEKYEEIKKTTDKPVKTREEIDAERAKRQ